MLGMLLPMFDDACPNDDKLFTPGHLDMALDTDPNEDVEHGDDGVDGVDDDGNVNDMQLSNLEASNSETEHDVLIDMRLADNGETPSLLTSSIAIRSRELFVFMRLSKLEASNSETEDVVIMPSMKACSREFIVRMLFWLVGRMRICVKEYTPNN
mmetsp:Transcript_36096/g.77827  ORF Transcript_36096/g.77827 Transcript_36096/m.77827 type:complete len:155 (-) Transcript_36096:45-509(-)